MRSRPLWFLTLLALGAGTVLGLLAPQLGTVIKPIGLLFLQALKLLVVPLVLVSITHAVGSLSNVGTAGRMGAYALIWYVGTTVAAVPLGLAIMRFVSVVPMPDLELTEGLTGSVSATPDLTQLIPPNIVSAMAEGN
ncbi:cation:dicarboxylate symporter family transporter, partial [Aequoribacter sp.]|uniref:cation:dicarboxylate symporter family transporter n=1 Tax=Aequoribacter sp. TaxID=2847771 RepID=UPI003F69C79F